jgi:hypothetical protein
VVCSPDATARTLATISSPFASIDTVEHVAAVDVHVVLHLA